MDRLIYTSMTGAIAAEQRQSILANNLANVSTNGFRAELSTFRAVPLRGDGATTRVFAAETTTSYRDTAGPALRTDRNLDAMAQGSAWFAVQGLDGTEGYTRHGAFEVSTAGTLVTSNGLPVLSDGGATIEVPTGANISIGSDGTVSAKVGNQPSTSLGRLKLATAVPEDRMVRGTDGLFRATSGDPFAQDATARLQTGVLEGSNVNPVETMVGMIATARQFETQMRLLQTAESNDRSAGQLLSLQG
jgi:flagellar basal-body rod protein FlgF